MRFTSTSYKWIFLLTLLAIAALSMPVFGIDNIEQLNQELSQSTGTVAQNTSIWWDFAKMLVALALILAVAWLLIRLFGRQLGRKMQGHWLRVVDEVVLGQNRGIILCEVGGKLYVLGVTDHNISLLFPVDNLELMEEVAEQDFETGPSQDAGIAFFKKNRIKLGWEKAHADKKDFSQLINQQSQRLEQISRENMEENTIGKKRNGKNDD